MRHVLRLIGYLRPYLLYFLLSVVLMSVVGAMAAVRILLVKPILDNVLKADMQPVKILQFHVPYTSLYLDLQRFVPAYMHNAWTVVAFALVLSAVMKALCDYAGTYLINYAGFGLITDLRDDLYHAILQRPVSFFQRYTTGALVSTLVNDIERVQIAMSSVLGDFLQQFFTLLFTVAVVIITGGRLAWLLLAFVPIIFFSARKIGRGVRKTTRGGQDKLSDIQNILQETLTGHRIVKAFNMEAWEMQRFRQATRKLLRANMRSVTLQAISSPLMDALGAVAIALLLFVGRYRIVHHQMTAGSFITFLIAVFALYDPVRKFALFYNSFQQAVGASETIFKFLDEQNSPPQNADVHKLDGFRQEITFSKVAFSYPDDDEELTTKQVLHNISFRVERGDMVAFVGPSGSGKSTMVSLLPRFFDPTSGSITIDGYDLTQVEVGSLRRLIGTVTQDTILFNDTVRNNIAYGQRHIALEEVERAARAAMAHDFIVRMPDGYNTVIGERGFRLSGGERQRLAIARAILKNAPILILDEATSALDAESESLVQHALSNLMADRTVLVIAHRLSTVRQADSILVVDHGRIVEKGSHAELRWSGGVYQRLYEMQFAGDEPITSPMAETVPQGT